MQYAPRLIAFYLPQYHPIPENDAWWGKGFTEWTNVAKAKPLFKGHYQPHIPADLGFYDLRVPETRQTQADLAREYGIHGFCYYHYWFNGKQLLERPFKEVLESGEPDFPFCLCWANENWTRRWDGKSDEVLIQQNYSEEDDKQHINELLHYFQDKRYIRINGNPLLIVYRIHQLPNPRKTALIWRNTAEKAGFPGIHLCMVKDISGLNLDPESVGFDSALDFVPDWQFKLPPKRPFGFNFRYIRWIQKRFFKNPYAINRINSYSTLLNAMLNRPEPKYKLFPGITPGWDNSPRRDKNAIIFTNNTPKAYGKWLQTVIKQCQSRFPNPEEHIVFINAWNEWAEGNHLEPDLQYGRAYLEETKKALDLFTTNQ